jgi:hypothetical protein
MNRPHEKRKDEEGDGEADAFAVFVFRRFLDHSSSAVVAAWAAAEAQPHDGHDDHEE